MLASGRFLRLENHIWPRALQQSLTAEAHDTGHIVQKRQLGRTHGRSLSLGLFAVAIQRELRRPLIAAYTQIFEPIPPQLRLHEVVLSEKLNHDLRTLGRLFELKKMCRFR